MLNLILLGAPGAGKGTQAEVISKYFSIPAISTGNIIREALRSGSEMGLKAKEFIEAGKLVPDEVVIGIIQERIREKDCENGFILDGFPRTVPQAQALDAMGVNMDLVISIEVPDEKIVARMGGRRLCKKCGSTYHILYNPSEAEGKCDKCDGELYTRADDVPEVVKERLHVYHDQTEPLKEYYASKGKLVTVEGQEQVADTTALTLAAIEKFRG